MAKELLWIENDDPDRFLFEVLTFEEKGWRITWSNHLLSAARLLAERPFDAILLDQVFAVSGRLDDGSDINLADEELDLEEDIWSGCRLLCWLRDLSIPEDAPLSDEAQKIHDLVPRDENRQAPVCLVSAYYNKGIEKFIERVSQGETPLRIVRKPIHITELLKFFEN